jgi:single-stranded-DNA-specific exonuclease
VAEVRLQIPPALVGDVLALERELGVGHAVAQVLVRRGLGDPALAREWLAAGVRHDLAAFGGMDEAVEAIELHVRAGSRIVVHGDYDVDGVASTAVLVRTLRELGADVGWYLPSRTEDGYGLNVRTVDRLAAQGTKLLVTVDCGITAVGEVAAARQAGMDVVITDHHTPRTDGALPDAPIVHPRIGGYPCVDLCATGVAYLLARALFASAGRDPAEADADLDLVALATVADCVPLCGENRRLVREGLLALGATKRPGLRALMAVSRCDPTAVDARSCGFRLAPRINAAGRLHRADAGLELLLTEDADRARQIAEELDSANAERRHVETRILFEAEAQIAELARAREVEGSGADAVAGGEPRGVEGGGAETDEDDGGQAAEAGEPFAYVLAGVGWHPGVIGIVASRIAERHHRPAVLIALPEGGGEGTGSGRSIPSFDLLAGLDAGAEHLLRHGGHRAAAGLTIAPENVDAFRASFVAHAEGTLSPDDLIPSERVDAVVAGDELGADLAEELARLAPFGEGNPEVSLLVPAARLTDPRAMGEGKHVRFTVEAGGVRARAVAFGTARLPAGAEDGTFDATFGLELNEWNGAVEPRLVLRRLVPCGAGPIGLAGEPEDPVDAALIEMAAAPEGARVGAATAAPGLPREGGMETALEGALVAEAPVRDRRGGGIAGIVTSLVASGEPVLVVCADARARRTGLAGRLGGFALCSWTALARDPGIARPYAHVVALDPPAEPDHDGLLGQLGSGRMAHLAWGEPELAFAVHVHRRDLDLRAPLRELYLALRGVREGDLAEVLGDVPPALAGRALRVLGELGLVELDGRRFSVPAPAGRTELERSAAFRAYQVRLEEGRRWLSRETSRAA